MQLTNIREETTSYVRDLPIWNTSYER